MTNNKFANLRVQRYVRVHIPFKAGYMLLKIQKEKKSLGKETE